MANLGGTYDASQGDTMDDRSPIPAGDYVLIVSDSGLKTNDKTGNKCLVFEYEVFEGEMKGRKMWVGLNLWHQNRQTVEIAQKEMNSLCKATGKLQVQDSIELHGIPFRAKVGIKKDKTGQYGDQNVVKKYEPYTQDPAGGTIQQQSQTEQQTTQQQTEQTSTGTGPWS